MFPDLRILRPHAGMATRYLILALLGVTVFIIFADQIYYKHVDPRHELANGNASTADHVTKLYVKYEELDKRLSEVYQNVLPIQSRCLELHLDQASGKFEEIRDKISALVQWNSKTSKKSDADDSIAAAIDHEKIHNFFALRNVPADVRDWFTYSEIEVSKLSQLNADHPLVIDHIRKYKLILPPRSVLRKKDEVKEFSKMSAQHLSHIFKSKSRGFFVECGAFDGMWISNTMYLEHLLDLTGVTIEAEPNNFEEAVQKKRNVHLVPSCLSNTTRPMLVNFTFVDHVHSRIKAEASVLPVQCFPLHSILLALGRTTVDFFSLGIEGKELGVLKTVPFDLIDIKVLAMEFKSIEGGKKALADFMFSKGYMIYQTMSEGVAIRKWAEDGYIFVKKSSGYEGNHSETPLTL